MLMNLYDIIILHNYCTSSICLYNASGLQDAYERHAMCLAKREYRVRKPPMAGREELLVHLGESSPHAGVSSITTISSFMLLLYRVSLRALSLETRR